MANMNLGPQKPPQQQFQPQPLINNNNQPQNMMMPPTSINNNNQFPQPPINGHQNGSQMPPMANKPPLTQFPPQQTQQLPPQSSVPQTIQQQLPNQQGQRPPIPGLESANPMVQNGQMHEAHPPQVPPTVKTPQMPPVNQFPQNVPYSNLATSPISNMQPPQQQQNQFPGMPPMPSQQQQFPGMAPISNHPQQPFMQQRSMPPMPAQQSSMPPIPGQQPPMPGQQPPMPGQFTQPGQQFQQQPQMQFPGMPAQPFQSPGTNRNFNQPPQIGGYPQQQQPGYPTSPMQAAAPQKRLDPDQMPNPIQVMSENQRACGGVFSTLQIGQVPPLVTTQFITQDQGNSGPRYMRSTMYNIPANTDMMKQSAIPFALIISPFAKTVEQEMAPPIVDFGEIGPIRCVRCKAYMSPYMQFVDAGRRFQCLLCKATTEG